jgi:AraC-like DNA-binding protein
MARREASAAPALAGQDDTLTTVYAGVLGRVEYLDCSGKRRGRGGRASSTHFHIVLPLSGSFVWYPGKHEIFADSATAVFAGGGEDFEISHPVSGDRSLVIWPTGPTLEAMTRTGRKNWKRHPAFASRTRRTTHEIQKTERALIAACSRPENLLKVEEILAQLLSSLVDDGASTARETAGAHRTVSRAKSLLQERLPERLTLGEVAGAVGVSPVYLTQLFRNVEGVPLYQYALNLRLVAALDALAQSDDITRLAIDVGFSSHSHFTAAFGRRFGASPSTLRAELRGDEQTSVRAAQSRAVRPLCATRGGAIDWRWS